MRSFCLLTAMEQIIIPNCSLLCLDSNDMKSFKNLFLKNYKYDCHKNTQINPVCKQLGFRGVLVYHLSEGL